MSNITLELIKSLDRGEKRYVNLRMNLYPTKSYAVMYFHLIKQEEYDATKTIAFLHKKGFKMEISLVLHHLYKKIMELLRAYHLQKIDPYHFLEHYQNALVMQLKNEPKFFEKEKKQLVEIAQKRDNFIHSYIGLNLNSSPYTEMSESYFSKRKAHFAQKIALLERELLAQRLFQKLIQLQYHQFISNDLTLMKQLVGELEEIDYITSLSFNCQITYYAVLNQYYQNVDQELIKALQNWRKVISLHEQLDFRKQELIDSFFGRLRNYMQCLCLAKKWNEYHTFMDSYQNRTSFFKKYQIPATKMNIALYAYNAIYSKVYFYIHSDFEGEVSLTIEELKAVYFPLYNKGVVDKSKIVGLYAIMSYWIYKRKSYLYLYDFISEYFNCYPFSKSSYYMSRVHLFHLVGLYEAKHRYFDTELQKKVYWFKTNGLRDNPFIKLVCSLFRRLHQRIQPQDKLNLLEEYLLKTEQLPEDVMFIINIKEWLKNKIQEFWEEMALGLQ